MIPNFTIGDKIISAYFIMALIGIFAAGCFSISKVKGEAEKLDFLSALLWSAVGLFLGGHLLFAITNTDKIISAIAAGADFKTIFLNYFTGNVFYGGLIGGYTAFVLFLKIKKLDYRNYIDQGTLFVPLFHTFGRVGCFLSGCCYGMESEIGFVYKHSIIEEANGVTRFPVQLVEAGGNLLLFFLLYHFFKRGILRHSLLSVYLTIYPVMRFILEFFRGDTYRGFLFGLSTSQIISVILFIYGVISLVLALRKEKKDEQTAEI